VSDLLMYMGLAIVAYILWRGLNNKPVFPFLSNRKKKFNDERSAGKAKEIQGDFKELIGIKGICGNLIELQPENGIRTFVGAVQCDPINYQLRSILEQRETDNAYEVLLASLSLGPGREVKIAVHVQSRPIELVDQLKQYHDAFGKLDPIAQRYAQSMFFPFMEQWQNSVDEYDYARFFFVILDYSPKMLEGLDEDMILSKAQNEFVRLSGNIISNYARMGGIAESCDIEGLLEAMYFATHKRSGTVEGFRSILSHPGRLSNSVTSDYSRDAVRYLEDEEEKEVPDDKVS
jgi:hypothetical protein